MDATVERIGAVGCTMIFLAMFNQQIRRGSGASSSEPELVVAGGAGASHTGQ